MCLSDYTLISNTVIDVITAAEKINSTSEWRILCSTASIEFVNGRGLAQFHLLAAPFRAKRLVNNIH